MAGDPFLFCVEPGDLVAVMARQPHPDRGGRVKVSAAGHAMKRVDPRVHLRCVGRPLDQLLAAARAARLRFGLQMLAALDQRPARRPPHRQQLSLLVGAGVLAGALRLGLIPQLLKVLWSSSIRREIAKRKTDRLPVGGPRKEQSLTYNAQREGFELPPFRPSRVP
jgi:hypothetical protein